MVEVKAGRGISRTRETRRLYHRLGYVTVFTYFRLFHAPYSLVESLVPHKGSILDLGCGYGFFSNMLGLTSPQREVIGIELDRRKVKYADRNVRNVRFINGDITKAKLDKCDAIVLFHVLHHLSSFQAQHRLLKECYRKLRDGGELIVVEIDYRPLWKFLFTLMIDTALYAGDRFYYRSRKQFGRLFTKVGFTPESETPAHRFVPLSHIVYTCRK